MAEKELYSEERIDYDGFEEKLSPVRGSDKNSKKTKINYYGSPTRDPFSSKECGRIIQKDGKIHTVSDKKKV